MRQIRMSLLVAPPDKFFERYNGALAIPNDVYLGLGGNFSIEFGDCSLINLIRARREPFRFTYDVGDSRRDRVVEVTFFRLDELCL